MKKLLFGLLLLGLGTARAQEVKPNTPEHYAKCFETFFYYGFMFGFGEGEYDIDTYIQFATQHTQTTPKEILHQTFLNALPEIDPLQRYKRINSAEEFAELSIGNRRTFSIGFFEGGYKAAMRAAGLEDRLTPQKVSEIHTLCEFLYMSLITDVMEKMK